jgi:hypothetical protein
VVEPLLLRAAGAGMELAEGAFSEANALGRAIIATGDKSQKMPENEPLRHPDLLLAHLAGDLLLGRDLGGGGVGRGNFFPFATRMLIASVPTETLLPAQVFPPDVAVRGGEAHSGAGWCMSRIARVACRSSSAGPRASAGDAAPSVVTRWRAAVNDVT